MLFERLIFQYDFTDINLVTAMPLLSAVLVLTLAILVLLQNWRSNMNILFSIFSFCISLWLFGTFMLFISPTDELAIFWDRFIYLGVIMLPMLLYQFGAAFAEIKIHRWILFVGYTLTVFFLIISQTDYFVSGLFKYQWGQHTLAQFWHHAFLVFFFYFNIRGIVFIYQRYKHVSDVAEKQRAKYAFIAFVVLYTLGPLGFLPAYKIAVYPIAYLGGVPFVLILTYTITRYRLFNLKAVAAEIFSFLFALFFLIQIFTAPTQEQAFIYTSLFVLVILFGGLLIQSALIEVRQRERLEQLTSQLADLNTNLQKKVDEQTQEVKKAYAIEKKARLEQEELDKAKDQFILTTQHHLRTPLTIIKGFLETALNSKEAKAMSAEMQSYLQKSSLATDRMAHLINDFLNMSQLEVGKSVFNFKSTLFKKIIEEILDELKPEIEKRGLYFKLDFSSEADGVTLNLDREFIKAALYNLIDNAVKYTPSGGVAVTTTVIVHPIEKIKMLHMEIQDTGIGLTPEEIEKLFRSYFQRGEEAEKIYTTGRGMGLVLSRNIIKAHKGNITVKSEGRGKGSMFIVELPFGL